MTELTRLMLNDNQIDDIVSLSGMTKLNFLQLAENQITDISSLAGMTELNQLNLDNNAIRDIDPLEALVQLDYLSLLNNSILSLDAIVGLTELTTLKLNRNGIQDIQPISGLTKLTFLGIGFNPIRDVDPLMNITGLRELWMNGTQVSNIAALSYLSNLERVYLQKSNIVDIGPLSNHFHLTELDIRENPLGSETWTFYIPRILANNPGIELLYDEVSWHTLMVNSGLGGSVIAPGEGVFQFVDGQTVAIEAILEGTSYRFDRWTGSATTVGRRGKVDNPLAPKTTVLMDGDYTLEAVFAARDDGPALGITLGEIDVDEPAQYYGRVVTNNTPEATLVEYVTGAEPDPNGMIRMQVIEEQSARAKGRFGACTAGRVLVRFDYLFDSTDDIEFLVYLSDVPELLDHGSRQRDQHYVEIGRVPVPPPGRPGSPGSERFGTFETWASTGGLDLTNGTWIELELISASPRASVQSWRGGGLRLAGETDGSAYFDNWAVEIHCDGICMDLNGSTTVDEEDFMVVIAGCGREAKLIDGGQNGLRCLEGAFTTNGYVDTYDLYACDWTLNDASRPDSYCHDPLSLTADADVGTHNNFSQFYPTGPGARSILVQTADLPGDLLVLGKRHVSTFLTELCEDCLCVFDSDPNLVTPYIDLALPVRCNVRLVRGPSARLYLVNSEKGVVRMDGMAETIIPPSATTWASDSRYHAEARVYLGIQGTGDEQFGRPVLDVAFDTQGDAYVVPVVVAPAGEAAYLAAARLRMPPAASTPYELAQLYDDPPPANDNQRRDCLREIEVDPAGNVYVTNADGLNQGCTLWKFRADGTLADRRGLLDDDSGITVPDPLAMTVSSDGQMLYLASGQRNPETPDDSTVQAFSTEDLTPIKTIVIEDMQQITSISQDSAGTLWIVGFNMSDIPEYPNPFEPFYIPVMAQVPADANTAKAVNIADSVQHNLALPTSIVWVGE